MARLLVRGFTISLDGYGAGPDQSLDNPLGIGGESLHQWLVGTRTFHSMVGKEGGETGIDDQLAAQSMAGVGAWILGRNMFSPIRGPWPDETWRGWWGENPPYHSPVYVLTHYKRPSLEMEGGTVFHFVTDGIHAALEQAQGAAGAQDIRLLGGASTIRQYLRCKLIDELHLAVSPILLGRGEHLFEGIDLNALGYQCEKVTPSPKAVHYVLVRR
ncbi:MULTISPECIES: dihydrofolate reductase family protein [unclassified Schlesneria]|uniref:dihydrofolate reductase family protein n=1 Tax=unclassified Schlesneria TaxID=2762017 RepID=UPI002F05A9B8